MTNTIETGAATADMTDTGLLLLRIATGATMLQAGLIKAFDFGTAVGFMESSGWRLRRLAPSWSPRPRHSAASACCSAS
ncbi:DoxX family protein [Mycolicibacterium fortuitum]|uniref:DoxX family protein n=1 Tax=Mycolicibacterium fortuitum TaxID=1766 RepID=A0A378UUH9_MYCFO|nr:DoxX family protein [Mycolicibacterium fortuitum]